MSERTLVDPEDFFARHRLGEDIEALAADSSRDEDCWDQLRRELTVRRLRELRARRIAMGALPDDESRADLYACCPPPVAVEVLRVGMRDSDVLELAAEVERLRSANQANLGTAAAGWSAAANLLDELGRRGEAYAARQTVQLLEKLAKVEATIGSWPEWAEGKKRVGPLLRCGLYESGLCQVAARFGGEVDCLACEMLGGEP